MGVLFADRADAGRWLALRLEPFASRQRLRVLGLPRGGVPVAAVVARAFDAPLDVLVVRKLGVPGQEEVAMGAVAGGGVRVIEDDIVQALGIPPTILEAAATAQTREVERRELMYRGGRPFPDLAGATVLLVDDGVATGATMRAAIRVVESRHPAAVIVAAPVMAREAHDALAPLVDACVTLAIPEPFLGVGASYRDFTQTSDEEVLALLRPRPAGTPTMS